MPAKWGPGFDFPYSKFITLFAFLVFYNAVAYFQSLQPTLCTPISLLWIAVEVAGGLGLTAVSVIQVQCTGPVRGVYMDYHDCAQCAMPPVANPAPAETAANDRV